MLAGSVSEIDGAVEGLLGLTFDHFTRAVVLPQNEFARFLHDKPAARQDLLIKLLGFDVYERMMRNARARAAEQETAVKLAEQQLEGLADCTPEQLEVWGQWVALYRQLREDVRGARDALRSLEQQQQAASVAATRARDIVSRLEKTEMPATVAKLAAQREEAVGALDARVKAAAESARLVEAAAGCAGRARPEGSSGRRARRARRAGPDPGRARHRPRTGGGNRGGRRARGGQAGRRRGRTRGAAGRARRAHVGGGARGR